MAVVFLFSLLQRKKKGAAELGLCPQTVLVLIPSFDASVGEKQSHTISEKVVFVIKKDKGAKEVSISELIVDRSRICFLNNRP